MRKVTYSLTVSLDGYIIGPDGEFDWATPSDEVFAYATDEARGVDVHLMGRRLYETMLYWETADQDPSIDALTQEFATLWRALPKLVFSTTLTAVAGNTRLVSGDLAGEIERLKRRQQRRAAGRGSRSVLGAGPHLPTEKVPETLGFPGLSWLRGQDLNL